jgi:hypothetical protein
VENGLIVFQAGVASVFSSALPLCEFGWRLVIQAAVWTLPVVVASAVGDDSSCFEQVLEPADAEAFFAQFAVEALPIAILRRLARLCVNQVDLAFQVPGRKCRLVSSGPLSQRIDCGKPRSAMIWSSTRVTRRPAKTCVHFHGKTLARVGVNHVQHSNRAP